MCFSLLASSVCINRSRAVCFLKWREERKRQKAKWKKTLSWRSNNKSNINNNTNNIASCRVYFSFQQSAQVAQLENKLDLQWSFNEFEWKTRRWGRRRRWRIFAYLSETVCLFLFLPKQLPAQTETKQKNEQQANSTCCESSLHSKHELA